MDNRFQLWNKYVVTPDLIYKLNSKNIHNIVGLKNIVLKSTINTTITDSKDILFGLVALELLSNQRAKVLRTRKSIAAFKTRKFMPISSKVTMRNKNLYSFLDFFVSVVLPRTSNIKELAKGSLVRSNASVNIGLSNLTTFLQLSKESEQLPKDVGITVTLNSNKAYLDYELLLLLNQYQIPIIMNKEH
jgi:large subunit ribosomal protein L5